MSVTPNPNFTVTPYTADGTVNGSGVNIRTEPFTAGNSPIAQVNQGTHVSITGKTTVASSPADWYQIKYNDTNAYVATQYVDVGTSMPAATNAPAPSASATILRVPWFSQVDSSHFEACGPTSVLMLLEAYKPGGVNPLAGMSQYVTITNPTGPDQLISAALHAGRLTLTHPKVPADSLLSTLRDNLTQRKPVILFLDYRKLTEAPFSPPRYLKPDPVIDHWWVVVGTDGDNFVINDPLWKSTDNGNKGGFNLLISSAGLKAAYANDMLVPSDPLP